MFQPVPASAPFPRMEEEVLAFWKEQAIYEKSLERRRGSKKFVFFEGPPTANGMPHPGHCLTRAIKDLFPRYRTMRGYFCERKAGWDTHGLPVEVEVCKELGIHSKEEIENYGVEPFIHRCQESVWRYMQEWERLTERLGFWVNLKEAYVTYHQSFVESVWWSLKNLYDRGLLYQGHKIVWWWAQGGTALSSGEVGQGYREVADPSVYVLFPLLDDADQKTDTSLLVWTTTPWTLPSNQFAAVHPDLDYATVVDSQTGQRLIIAAALVETLAGKIKRELTVESTSKGSTLLGKRYVPPYDYYYQAHGNETGKLKDGGKLPVAWRVVAADFVTTDSGSGVVHQAPAFGEVDFDVLVAEQAKFEAGQGPHLICAVGPDGKFTKDAPEYEGRWVKDCDKDIQRELKAKGLLYHQEQYLHDYPFCWRADQDPLIQYPRRSWFVKTTQFKDEMLANNQQINWLPEHIKDGRFGNFLESNVDWALSRERYWGTPLPIWVCQQTGQMEAVGSYEELLQKPGVKGTDVWDKAKAVNPKLPDDLKVHKPYIDEITYDSPFAKGAHMRRVSEVIDCWYDSGAMPFAQWGYPHQGVDKFAEQFPADFISEAIDQTRGWFYSQLAISTLLFGKGTGGEGREAGAEKPYPHPFKNCIVLGLMMGEDGTKMSKSKRNYREPREIFDKYGADALRWYFFANQPPWTTIRYAERAIKDSIPEFLLRLWNCYSFFVIYSNIDGFDPGQRVAPNTADLSKGKGYRPVKKRGELDRWILSELNRTLAAVIERMDAYDNFEACKQINAFVDGLSNWYVRRSRDRFWSSDKEGQEKLDAYWTLYECLLTTAKLIAPFTPFLSETLWRNLTGVFGERALESVHLCDYPEPDAAAIDETLSARMQLLREIASLGRSARMDNKLKVRQPLAKVEVILSAATHQAWLQQHDALLRDELNVKQIEYAEDANKYITYQIQPNFKRLGPRIGKLLPECKKVLGAANGGELLAQMTANGTVDLKVGSETIRLDGEDLQVRLQAKPGWAAAQGRGVVVVLSTEITPELVREGYANDLVRAIQDRRKDLQLEYTARITIRVAAEDPEVSEAIQEHGEFIRNETLCDELTEGVNEHSTEIELGAGKLQLSVKEKI
ncbi:Isoleucine--tRNA ligase [Anatilimnocola aggregata]|uniref:Isoleucine--tRNA ligase n=1 Tax=Anatilimnocola aggregata TaxID=2528021 RepID=A0A517YIA5_9BACT|nr:isoleucine--tRNA ligase [Anatilimnocola aggregata]QDU29949.1 Isoleucine--tRNA ligase [Anatilimnocola aggregata]